MDGASFVSKRDWQVFFRKLVGKNAKEGVFPRFAGFRYRSIAVVRPFDYAQGPHHGNGYAALPIGARLGFAKTAPRPALVFQRQLPR